MSSTDFFTLDSLQGESNAKQTVDVWY